MNVFFLQDLTGKVSLAVEEKATACAKLDEAERRVAHMSEVCSIQIIINQSCMILLHAQKQQMNLDMASEQVKTTTGQLEVEREQLKRIVDETERIKKVYIPFGHVFRRKVKI